MRTTARQKRLNAKGTSPVRSSIGGRQRETAPQRPMTNRAANKPPSPHKTHGSVYDAG